MSGRTRWTISRSAVPNRKASSAIGATRAATIRTMTTVANGWRQIHRPTRSKKTTVLLLVCFGSPDPSPFIGSIVGLKSQSIFGITVKIPALAGTILCLNGYNRAEGAELRVSAVIENKLDPSPLFEETKRIKHLFSARPADDLYLVHTDSFWCAPLMAEAFALIPRTGRLVHTKQEPYHNSFYRFCQDKGRSLTATSQHLLFFLFRANNH